MPRARTGTLVPPGADGFWRARVTKDHPDGTNTRPLYSLGTTDRTLARRKLARLVALIQAGPTRSTRRQLGAPERVKDYAEAWLKKREAQGVVDVREDERMYLERYALEAIGADARVRRPPVARARHSRRRGANAGSRRERVAAHRAASCTDCSAPPEEEIVEHNPVAAVRTPKMREVRKERAILTDDEFSRFVACAQVDLELRMLSLVARCEGGMRTGDLNRGTGRMIDRVHFAECFVPRAKTRNAAGARDPRQSSPRSFARGGSAPASRRAALSSRRARQARGKLPGAP